jgi:hypothetical protein
MFHYTFPDHQNPKFIKMHTKIQRETTQYHINLLLTWEEIIDKKWF